jgi:MFS family permease
MGLSRSQRTARRVPRGWCGSSASSPTPTACSAPTQRGWGLVPAVRHILRVRTNVVLIAASALGYFFFAGLQTFAVAFLRRQFSLGQSVATSALVALGIGAVAGVLAGGRLADRALDRGRVNARVVVPAVAYAAAALILAPAVATTSLLVAMPLYLLAAAALSAPNPPLDAARLDIMPSGLWDAPRASAPSCVSSRRLGPPWRSGPRLTRSAGTAAAAFSTPS